MTNSLLERVKKDIKENPEKLDMYLEILLDKGLLKGVEEVRLKKVNSKLLKKLIDNNTVVYIK